MPVVPGFDNEKYLKEQRKKILERVARFDNRLYLEFGGKIVFDKTRPDGPPRKLLDVSRLAALGWRSKTPLREGLRATYADFVSGGGRGRT